MGGGGGGMRRDRLPSKATITNKTIEQNSPGWITFLQLARRAALTARCSTCICLFSAGDIAKVLPTRRHVYRSTGTRQRVTPKPDKFTE